MVAFAGVRIDRHLMLALILASAILLQSPAISVAFGFAKVDCSGFKDDNAALRKKFGTWKIILSRIRIILLSTCRAIDPARELISIIIANTRYHFMKEACKKKKTETSVYLDLLNLPRVVTRAMLQGCPQQPHRSLPAALAVLLCFCNRKLVDASATGAGNGSGYWHALASATGRREFKQLGELEGKRCCQRT